MVDYPSSLDHLVVAGPDFDAAVRWVEARLGVTLLPGGQHPAWGTRNAILPIGPSCYLEVIGSLQPGTRPELFGISALTSPMLVTWAAKSEDLALTLVQARALDIDLGARMPGRRVREDGTVLSWELTDPMAQREGGLIPFFINWKNGIHPSGDGHREVELARLDAQHPDPEQLMERLEALGVPLVIQEGPVPHLSASFSVKGKLVHL
jgi:hypothetical protein